MKIDFLLVPYGRGGSLKVHVLLLSNPQITIPESYANIELLIDLIAKDKEPLTTFCSSTLAEAHLWKLDLSELPSGYLAASHGDGACGCSRRPTPSQITGLHPHNMLTWPGTFADLGSLIEHSAVTEKTKIVFTCRKDPYENLNSCVTKLPLRDVPKWVSTAAYKRIMRHQAEGKATLMRSFSSLDLFLEDWEVEPSATWKDLQTFLGVSPTPLPERTELRGHEWSAGGDSRLQRSQTRTSPQVSFKSAKSTGNVDKNLTLSPPFDPLLILAAFYCSLRLIPMVLLGIAGSFGRLRVDKSIKNRSLTLNPKSLSVRIRAGIAQCTVEARNTGYADVLRIATVYKSRWRRALCGFDQIAKEFNLTSQINATREPNVRRI